jgi:transcriptional regulator of acetoin/glycerol metabolism
MKTLEAATTSGSALQHVLDRVEESGRPPGAVPDSIHLSWARCAGAGITPRHVAVPFEADIDADSRLAWAAAPAMNAVSVALADEPVALLLTDTRGQIVQRFVGSPNTSNLMDNIGAAPGFVCREELVGTNSIGMALLTSSRNVVAGFEHYADNLTVVSCASAPVVHPATGEQLGVINITSTVAAFHAALPALLDRVVADTHARLSEDHGVPSVALRAAFLSARRKSKGPLIAISANTMYFNTTAGATLASHQDRAAVWAWAEQQIHNHHGAAETVLTLSRGPRLARAVPVYDGASIAGALVSLGSRPSSHPNAVPPEDESTSGWSSLTQAERTIAQEVARGLTNRETAVLLFLSPHTVDYHLRQIYRKLSVQTRIGMARAISTHV